MFIRLGIVYLITLISNYKEDKTMKKLMGIMACIVLCLSLVGCKLGKEDTAWIEDAAKKIGDDITCGEMVIDGVVFRFPMDLQDVLDKGWHISNNITNEKSFKLGVGEYSEEFQLFPDDNHENSILVSVINMTDEETTVENCMVASLRVKENHFDFVLPGEITRRSTQEEIEKEYGEATETKKEDHKKVYKYTYTSKDGFDCYIELSVYNKENAKNPLSQVYYAIDINGGLSKVGWQEYIDACMKASFYNDWIDYVKYGYDTKENAEALYQAEIEYYAYAIMEYSDITVDYVTEDVVEEFCDIAKQVLKKVNWKLSQYEAQPDGTYSLELTLYPTNYFELIDSKVDEAIEEYDTKYATVDFDSISEAEHVQMELDYVNMVLKAIDGVEKDVEIVSGIKRVYEIDEIGFTEKQWEEIDDIIMGFKN